MPLHKGLELGQANRILADGTELDIAWTPDFDASKLGGIWLSSGVCFRQTWHDVGPSGDNWTQSVLTREIFKLSDYTGQPWERFAVLVLSAHIWSYIGGTGTYDLGCGTSIASPTSRNVLNQSSVTAGLEWRFWAKTDFDASFERGRLVDPQGDNIFRLRFDGTGLSTGPTGSVSVAVFGVLVQNPSVSDS